MAAYIHDLIGTWWSTAKDDLLSPPFKVTEVHYSLEGPHRVKLGVTWHDAHFDGEGQPYVVGRVRRDLLPPPTWMAPLELAAEYIAKARVSTDDWLAPRLFDDLERILAETWSDLHAGPTPRP